MYWTSGREQAQAQRTTERGHSTTGGGTLPLGSAQVARTCMLAVALGATACARPSGPLGAAAPTKAVATCDAGAGERPEEIDVQIEALDSLYAQRVCELVATCGCESEADARLCPARVRQRLREARLIGHFGVDWACIAATFRALPTGCGASAERPPACDPFYSLGSTPRGAACGRDDECLRGMTCQDGACRGGQTAGTMCQTVLDCESGLTCDEVAPRGEYACVARRGELGDSCTNSCGPGLTCDTERRECVLESEGYAACASDADCPWAFSKCLRGRCGRRGGLAFCEAYDAGAY